MLITHVLDFDMHVDRLLIVVVYTCKRPHPSPSLKQVFYAGFVRVLFVLVSLFSMCLYNSVAKIFFQLQP